MPGIGKTTARALNTCQAAIWTIDQLAALTGDQQREVWEQLNAELPGLNLDKFCRLVKHARALGADVETVKGIGPKRAALLRKVGVLTVGELAGLSSDSEGWREAVELGYPRKTLHSAVEGAQAMIGVEKDVRVT